MWDTDRHNGHSYTERGAAKDVRPRRSAHHAPERVHLCVGRPAIVLQPRRIGTTFPGSFFGMDHHSSFLSWPWNHCWFHFCLFSFPLSPIDIRSHEGIGHLQTNERPNPFTKRWRWQRRPTKCSEQRYSGCNRPAARIAFLSNEKTLSFALEILYTYALTGEKISKKNDLLVLSLSFRLLWYPSIQISCRRKGGCLFIWPFCYFCFPTPPKLSLLDPFFLSHHRGRAPWKV